MEAARKREAVDAKKGEALRVEERQSGSACDACLSPVAIDEQSGWSSSLWVMVFPSTSRTLGRGRP